MNSAYLILGTNKGERLDNLARAMEMLEEAGCGIRERSAIYVTAPWGNPAQEDFYNQVIRISTLLDVSDLLAASLRTEERLGRKRDGHKWMARSMDIDILFYNNEVISREDLQVPHPHIAARRFVLMPLAEIAPDLMHPVLKKAIAAMLAECPDNLKVEKLH